MYMYIYIVSHDHTLPVILLNVSSIKSWCPYSVRFPNTQMTYVNCCVLHVYIHVADIILCCTCTMNIVHVHIR